MLFMLLLAGTVTYAQYSPAGDKIKSRWASEVNPDKVLPEYPRPLMTRQAWQNLNGLWNYAVTPTDAKQPLDYDGEILVPFSAEKGDGKEQLIGLLRAFCEG